MRIGFRSDGGIAFIPGLSRPTSFTLEELPAEDRFHLEKLLEEARFFTLPAQVGSPPGPDRRSYDVTVQTENTSHSVRFTEPIPDPAQSALVTFLGACARRVSSRSKA